MSYIRAVSFVARHTDDLSKLDSGMERKSDYRNDGSRRRNTRQVSVDWRPDDHSMRRGHTGSPVQLMRLSQAVRPSYISDSLQQRDNNHIFLGTVSLFEKNCVGQI